MRKIYNPCFECLNRYGREYTERCDKTCDYAKVVKEKQELIKMLKMAKENGKIILEHKHIKLEQFEYLIDLLIKKAQEF